MAKILVAPPRLMVFLVWESSALKLIDVFSIITRSQLSNECHYESTATRLDPRV
jgi:hypothetical protein